MIEGRVGRSPQFPTAVGKVVHYCNLYVKVAANYIEAFLNLLKYILYILIENEIIG